MILVRLRNNNFSFECGNQVGRGQGNTSLCRVPQHVGDQHTVFNFNVIRVGNPHSREGVTRRVSSVLPCLPRPLAIFRR